jgi:hypothetical protein
MSSAQRGYTGRMLRWSDRDRVLHEQTQRKLREDEVQDLVAFLHALSSDRLKRFYKGD